MDELFQRIETNFKKQGLMKTLNASLDTVEKGRVQISSEFDGSQSQQHGYFHAGAITSIVDSACGYAGLTMATADKDVLAVEFKMNFLRPANTKKIIAIGEVIKSGRTLTVCEGNVYNSSGEKLIARMTATMILVEKK